MAGQLSPVNIKGGLNAFAGDPTRVARVRLTVGFPTGKDKKDPSFGGQKPKIMLYDDLGRLWAKQDHKGLMAQGSFMDYHMKAIYDNQRPTYLASTQRKSNPARNVYG